MSYYRCICYLVFPALFPSINMVFIDYTCITSVTEYSKSLGCYLNDLKFFIMVASTIFQAHVTFVTLKIALNLQVNVCLFVCFVALRPKSTAMVIAGRSVHLTTLFPGQA